MNIITTNFNFESPDGIDVDGQDIYNTIAPMLLNRKEAQLKKMVWMENHAEELEEMKNQ